jgi:hypothetical protein
MWPYVLIGSCLKLFGWGLALDTYAQLPWCDSTGQYCTTSILGDAMEVPGTDDECWLPAPITDPWYDAWWCQPVTVQDAQVSTPCTADAVAKADAPYLYRLHWAKLACPDDMLEMQWCTREEVLP